MSLVSHGNTANHTVMQKCVQMVATASIENYRAVIFQALQYAAPAGNRVTSMIAAGVVQQASGHRWLCPRPPVFSGRWSLPGAIWGETGCHQLGERLSRSMATSAISKYDVIFAFDTDTEDLGQTFQGLFAVGCSC